MAIDMSQFYQVFFDEAAEHLASMESLLVAFDAERPDRESLNALFRAAHSIKGSSGTFGFGDIARITHVLETLLDRVREGEAVLDNPAVEACLSAVDALRGALAAHIEGREPQVEDTERVCACLQSCVAEVDDAAEASGRQSLCLEARFRPDAGCHERPELLDSLIDELAGIGKILHIERPARGVPGEWAVLMGGGVSADTVAGLIEFVAESGSLHTAEVAIQEGTDDELPAPSVQSLSAAGGPYDDFPGDEIAPDGSYGLFAQLPEPVPHPADDMKLSESVAVADTGVDGPEINSARDPSDSASLRVGVGKVDQVMDLVGELVITQAMLAEAAEQLDPVLHARLMTGLTQLERNTRDLQHSVMAIRMLPVGTMFSRFPRMVRDLSAQLGKQVQLGTQGEGTELDKSLIERISDPLTHLIRNSVDHGIEPPAERRAAGKRETGTITLCADQVGNRIVIEVIDDGRGLSRERILARAAEVGLEASDEMSDEQLWKLIFEPGFSTADEITEVSGRGVGMDVVRRNIADLGGTVDVFSANGQGTRVSVGLPLTLAILDGLSVGVGSETYVVALTQVIESLQPEPVMIRSVGGVERILYFRGEYLPVIRLADHFGVRGGVMTWEEGIIVVVEHEGIRAALFVDTLLGQQQVVVKSLEANYRSVKGVSAATILGNGRVALILDVAALAGGVRKPLGVAA